MQCGLWSAIDRCEALRTVAIIADIGNDLAYEAPVERIVDWVQTALDRLQSRGAQVVMNNVPIASIRTVGRARFHVFRELLFPSCRLTRSELLRRAEGLSDALNKLAEARKTPIFSGESAWYGLDPIHPRPRACGEIWRRMLGALSSTEEEALLVRASARAKLHLNALRPESWVQFGFQRSSVQPSGWLSDGTTIALY